MASNHDLDDEVHLRVVALRKGLPPGVNFADRLGRADTTHDEVRVLKDMVAESRKAHHETTEQLLATQWRLTDMERFHKEMCLMYQHEEHRRRELEMQLATLEASHA